MKHREESATYKLRKRGKKSFPQGPQGGANSVNTSPQTCSLQDNEKMHFCSLSLSVHDTLWTAQKTDISCNPKAVTHFAFCRGPAHSPTAHTVREPTHQPRLTTVLTTRWAHVLVLLNKKTQVARDVCSSTNQCFGVSKGKEPAMLHRDYPRPASDKQQSQRWRIHIWWGKSRVREKESLGLQKIRCDAQQRSAVQPWLWNTRARTHTHTHTHTHRKGGLRCLSMRLGSMK